MSAVYTLDFEPRSWIGPFVPRVLEHGRACCTNQQLLCPKCYAHQQENQMSHRTMRAAEGDYKDDLEARFAALRAETRDLEQQRAAAPKPKLRAMEAPEDVPNPYATVDERPTQRDLTPDLDPKYKPFGRPANGYALALGLRRFNEENKR